MMNKLFFLLISLIFIFSCQDNMERVEFVGKVKTPNPKIIAKVNNIPITIDDYNMEKQKLPNDLKKLLKKPEKRLQFIQNLIDKQLLYEESIKLKIDQDPEVQRKLNLIKKEIMIDALLKRLFALNVNVTDKEVFTYYKKHKNEYSNHIRS